MGEIARGLGISRATLYRYFPKRDALIHDLALESLRVTTEATAHVLDDAGSYEQIFERIVALVPFADRYNFLATEAAAYTNDEVKNGLEAQYEQMRGLIDAARRAGELDPDVPTSWALVCFDSLIWGAWLAVHEGRLAMREATEMVMRTFWKGVGLSEHEEKR